MITRSCPSRGENRRYSRSPCRASRCTRTSTSFARALLPARDASGRPVGQIARAIHRGLAQLSEIDGIAVHEGGDASVRLHLQGKMTVQPGGDDWRDLPGRLFPGSAHEPAFQVCGRNGVSSLSSRGRSSNPKLQRNIVKPARREAAIEMPQARNEHANDGDLNVGPRLVEHEEIVTCPGSDLDTGIDLIARVVVNLEAGRRRNDRIVARNQERIIFQAQRIDTVKRRLLAAAAAHHADRHELGQLGERTQQGDTAIEMRAGTELDVLVAVLHPVHDRHVGGNAEIAGDVEHPEPCARHPQTGLCRSRT